MDNSRSKFELYLEILTQIKMGNSDEESIRKCVNLSQRELDDIMDPLVSEKLLKTQRSYEGNERRIIFDLTDKGSQFIDFLHLGLNFIEDKNNYANAY